MKAARMNEVDEPEEIMTYERIKRLKLLPLAEFDQRFGRNRDCYLFTQGVFIRRKHTPKSQYSLFNFRSRYFPTERRALEHSVVNNYLHFTKKVEKVSTRCFRSWVARRVSDNLDSGLEGVQIEDWGAAYTHVL